VWADSQFSDIASTAANQFIARASGHFFLQSDSTLDNQSGFINTSTGGFLSTGGTWTNASDENDKAGFADVSPRRILARVAKLPVRSWHYKAEPEVRHIGPVAQDFYRSFGVGPDERHIASVDADGVALAAIKGLERELRAERRLRHRQARQFRARLAALERDYK
jgi:adhesin HecA-like repeat protein